MMIAENDSFSHNNAQESAEEQVSAHRIIPVLEERVVIEKALVETGRVRVSKEVITSQEVVNVP